MRWPRACPPCRQPTHRAPPPWSRPRPRATQWVALADAGDYAASWDQAASAFQQAVTKPQWTNALQTVRTPLGAVKSRKLKSAQVTASAPGAPAGEYVVVQFDTAFENKAAAVETVTPMKGKDGTWRVSGYFIK